MRHHRSRTVVRDRTRARTSSSSLRMVGTTPDGLPVCVMPQQGSASWYVWIEGVAASGCAMPDARAADIYARVLMARGWHGPKE